MGGGVSAAVGEDVEDDSGGRSCGRGVLLYGDVGSSVGHVAVWVCLLAGERTFSAFG